MELMARCGRCGALVESGTLVKNGGVYTVLCDDCMEQLNEWLAGESKEPQEAEDSAERLAADVASAFVDGLRYGICQMIACKYFGHGGFIGCNSGGPCRAYGDGTGGSESCYRAMLDDVRRRCKALGIDLEEDEDAGK